VSGAQAAGPRLVVARTGMMKRETFAIANIYVPVKRRATLDPRKVQEIAESILESDPGAAGRRALRLGRRTAPAGGVQAADEETVQGYLVQARRH
jgi:sulfiredoxin